MPHEMYAAGIAGLYWQFDYVTTEQEEAILEMLSPCPGRRNTNLRNRVLSYYQDADLGELPKDARRSWKHAQEKHYSFPNPLAALAKQIVDDGILPRVKMIAVNEYLPGQGVRPHTDHEMNGDCFAVLSLKSDAIMVMTHEQRRETMEVPARSLLLFTAAARWTWKHEIPAVERIRYSLVIRPL